MEEAAVRAAVDDVERALEHAEEGERRPEQERAADDAECGGVRLDPRTARRIESSDVFGNVFESWRTKNDPSSAWWTRPSSASDRKSSGTNERSAKYAIIAARCVPRSAKNLLTTRPTGGSMLAGVDAAQAISDLTEISPQVRHVAVIEADGSVTGSNLSRRGGR